MHMIFFIILPYFHLKIKNDLTDKNIFYIKIFGWVYSTKQKQVLAEKRQSSGYRHMTPSPPG